MLAILIIIAGIAGFCLLPRHYTEKVGIRLPDKPATRRLYQGVFYGALILIALKLKLIPFALILAVIAIAGHVMGKIKEKLLDNDDLREDAPRGGGQGAGQSSGQRTEGNWRSPSQGRMERTEALSVLGLKEGATSVEVDAAWRRLMTQIHPDKGGTDYLAGKLNEARAVLKQRPDA